MNEFWIGIGLIIVGVVLFHLYFYAVLPRAIARESRTPKGLSERADANGQAMLKLAAQMRGMAVRETSNLQRQLYRAWACELEAFANDHLVCINAISLEALAVARGEKVTYSSTQATNCAQCGEYKHTPLRVDAMDGYVCLTCIDKQLGSLLGEFGAAPSDSYSAKFRHGSDWSRYPLGTRAYAIGGGHWEKVHRGWKWCTGSTFPTPGADAFEVAVPTPDTLAKLHAAPNAVEQAVEGEEKCESGAPDCGAVEHYDSEGIPLCDRCWNDLASSSRTVDA